MVKNRYLTKSKFKLAMECPAKLYYVGKSDYADQTLNDDFLKSLADGGYQVGELAKFYFPGGHDIKTLDKKEALEQTFELLKQKNVIIYEAAICFENLFIRIDVLVKKGNSLKLIEVKSKSISTKEINSFLNKKDGQIKSNWKPYLYDVAFQKYVLSKAFNLYNISTSLMLVDKEAICPTDGLNQKFKILKDKDLRKRISVSSNLLKKDLSEQILTQINVDSYCEKIFNHLFKIQGKNLNFVGCINLFAKHYMQDKKISCKASVECAKCEFHTRKIDLKNNLKSGKNECWSKEFPWFEKGNKTNTILDIWNFRKKNQLLKQGKIQISEVSKENITVKPDNKPGLSQSERQWLQIEKAKNNDQTFWLDKENLIHEMSTWVYPLHFIDFETARVAIPFNKGQSPYDGIAFQFSHHIVYKDGRIEHKGEYLNTEPGFFPNYDFIRTLKKELENDSGSIFCYSPHENIFLKNIHDQIQQNKTEIPDCDELCEFIQSITKSKEYNSERSMIDMLELVKRYYYDPQTNGSNSIKFVLPAILNRSTYLQKKYSNPIYGTKNGIPSLNYKNWKWIKFHNGKVLDPYKLLPKMFQNISDKNHELLCDFDNLNNGGLALTTYAKMQFEEMTQYERDEIRQALLKYCELDTMAMVMIYEAWKNFVKN